MECQRSNNDYRLLQKLRTKISFELNYSILVILLLLILCSPISITLIDSLITVIYF